MNIRDALIGAAGITGIALITYAVVNEVDKIRPAPPPLIPQAQAPVTTPPQPVIVKCTKWSAKDSTILSFSNREGVRFDGERCEAWEDSPPQATSGK